MKIWDEHYGKVFVIISHWTHTIKFSHKRLAQTLFSILYLLLPMSAILRAFGAFCRSRLPSIQLQRNLPLATCGIGARLTHREGGGAEDPGLDVLLGVVVLDVMLDGRPNLFVLEESAGGGDVGRHVAVLVPGGHHPPHHLVHLQK